MENIYFSEVINGELIEIRVLNVRDILKSSLCKSEEDKVIKLITSAIKVNGSSLTEKQLLDWENIKAFNFASEAINNQISNQ